MNNLGEQLNKLDKSVADKRQKQAEERQKLLPYGEFLKTKLAVDPETARKQLGETCLAVMNIVAERLQYKYSIPVLPGKEPTVSIADAKICQQMLDATEFSGRKQDVPVSQVNIKKTLIVNVQESARELEKLLKDVVDI